MKRKTSRLRDNEYISRVIARVKLNNIGHPMSTHIFRLQFDLYKHLFHQHEFQLIIIDRSNNIILVLDYNEEIVRLILMHPFVFVSRRQRTTAKSSAVKIFENQ